MNLAPAKMEQASDKFDSCSAKAIVLMVSAMEPDYLHGERFRLGRAPEPFGAGAVAVPTEDDTLTLTTIFEQLVKKWLHPHAF